MRASSRATRTLRSLQAMSRSQLPGSLQQPWAGLLPPQHGLQLACLRKQPSQGLVSLQGAGSPGLIAAQSQPPAAKTRAHERLSLPSKTRALPQELLPPGLHSVNRVESRTYSVAAPSREAAVAELTAPQQTAALAEKEYPASADASLPEPERNGLLYIPEDPATRSSGLAVTWLGTSSGAPTRRRNVSGIALRTRQQTLLVDCGEATNRQIAVAGIHPLSITNILITHMHGDHCFGLMGVLTMISEARAGTALAQKALRVFGPPGIQDLVASTLQYSASQLSMPLVIAEFTLQPELSTRPQPAASLPGVSFAVLAPDSTDVAKSALSGGRTRRSDTRSIHESEVVDGLTWTIPCEHGLTVTAAQLQHRVPCWGYVVKEADKPPVEHPEKLRQHGLAPGTALQRIRNGAKPGDELETATGAKVQLRDLMHPPLSGRKVVLLGDTCDSRAIANAGRSADLLSHEATFSNSMSSKAYRAQHSTAAMAGAFARSINASALVLTHFSGRYSAFRGKNTKDAGGQAQDASADDISILLAEARAVFKGPVFPAQDFFTYDVWHRQQRPAAKPASGRLTADHRAGPALAGESPTPQMRQSRHAINPNRGLPRRGRASRGADAKDSSFGSSKASRFRDPMPSSQAAGERQSQATHSRGQDWRK